MCVEWNKILNGDAQCESVHSLQLSAILTLLRGMLKHVHVKEKWHIILFL